MQLMQMRCIVRQGEEMRAAKLQELEEMAATLLATARKHPPGPNRCGQQLCKAPIYGRHAEGWRKEKCVILRSRPGHLLITRVPKLHARQKVACFVETP
jgi:hypothetical protein